MKQLVVSSLVVLFVVGSGCGGEDKKKPSVQNASLETEPCAYAPSEGNTYDSSTRETKVEKGLFEKEYRREWLDSVLDTSIVATVPAIRATGADVFRAERYGISQCNSFNDIGSMPSAVAEVWKKSAEAGKSKDSYVSGLYLPRGEYPSVPGNSSRGTIIVRENQSRWTLVHEFMHHNFTEQSLRNGSLGMTDNLELVRLAEKIGPAWDDATTYSEKQVFFDRYGADAARFFVLYDKAILHSALEETTIETLLRTEYQSGRFRFVPEASARNSAWYAKTSLQRAKESYSGGIREALDDMIRYAGMMGHISLGSLNAARSAFNARLAQIERVSAEHPSLEADVRLLALTGPSTSIDGELEPILADHPCADADAVLERVEGFFGKRD